MESLEEKGWNAEWMLRGGGGEGAWLAGSPPLSSSITHIPALHSHPVSPLLLYLKSPLFQNTWEGTANIGMAKVLDFSCWLPSYDF